VTPLKPSSPRLRTDPPSPKAAVACSQGRRSRGDRCHRREIAEPRPARRPRAAAGRGLRRPARPESARASVPADASASLVRTEPAGPIRVPTQRQPPAVPLGPSRPTRPAALTAASASTCRLPADHPPPAREPPRSVGGTRGASVRLPWGPDPPRSNGGPCAAARQCSAELLPPLRMMARARPAVNRARGGAGV
jgi:hypothetical protein